MIKISRYRHIACWVCNLPTAELITSHALLISDLTLLIVIVARGGWTSSFCLLFSIPLQRNTDIDTHPSFLCSASTTPRFIWYLWLLQSLHPSCLTGQSGPINFGPDYIWTKKVFLNPFLDTVMELGVFCCQNKQNSVRGHESDNPWPSESGQFPHPMFQHLILWSKTG